MKPGIELANKRVLVVGLGRTGVATALFCAARGALVTVTEQRDAREIREAVECLRGAGCVVELGAHATEIFREKDLVVPSPGVPATLAGLDAARAAGIPIWSEVELAWRFLRGRMIGITGSNGKTTVTSLVGHILACAGMSPLIAGNIGTPLISKVGETNAATITVAELSSFQLELIAALRPEIAMLLNVTPDHLDRHGSFEAYSQAKARIFENQIETDAAVLNADDPIARQYAPRRPQLSWFSRSQQVHTGASLCGEQIVFRTHQRATVLLERGDIHLRGEHNVENVLAAASAAFLSGVDPAAIAAGVRSFPGVEHRLEFVAEIAGISFFNDSKATNVDAALKALAAFSGRLLVILGGKDKDSDYAPLAGPLRQRAKEVLLIGAAAEKIASHLHAQWNSTGISPSCERDVASAIPVERAGTLDRAVMLGFEHARPGDTVLLAPACASFDQFDNYEHRGRVFKAAVLALNAAHLAAPVREG